MFGALRPIGIVKRIGDGSYESGIGRVAKNTVSISRNGAHVRGSFLPPHQPASSKVGF
jgi:hypothetical protein